MRIARILQGGEIMLDHCILVKTALLLFVGLLLCFSARRGRGGNRGHQVLLLRSQNPPPCFHANPFGKRLDWLGALTLFCPLFWLPGTRRSPKLCRIDRRGL